MTTKRSSKPRPNEPDKVSVSVLADPPGPGRDAETVIALAIQAHVPVFVYSQPGSGKSATIRAISDELRSTLHTIMLSVREPTDQGGLPAVFEENGEKLVRIIPPGWARDLIRDQQGTVFLDEITNATPATMNSALRVVQEGVVGDGEKLPAATSFVLAGNPPETNVGANEITAGIANRCVHVAWPFDYARWRRGMLSRWAREDRQIPRLPDGWRDRIPTMASLIVAFLDTQPALAQAQPEDIGAQGRAWPSGRTWDLTATMLAAADAVGHGPRSKVGGLIALGLVGEAAQLAWSSWIANMDLPSIESVMSNPEAFPMPKRQDQILTVLSGVAGYVARHRGDLSTYMAAWTVLVRVLKLEPSLAVRTARDLGALMPPGADQMSETPFHTGLVLMTEHLRQSKVDYGSVA